MDDLFYINVGSQGTFQKTGTLSSTPEDVEAIIADIQQKNVDHVAIYIHGGLVDEKAGLNSAKRFRDVFEKADAYGISLIWKTGWWETIQQNLTTIFSTELFQSIVEKVLKRVIARFAIPGAKGPGDAELETKAVLHDPTADETFADTTRGEVEQLSAVDLERWRKAMEAELEADVAADQTFKNLYVDPAQRTSKFDDPSQEVHADPQAPQSRDALSWILVATRIAGVAWNVGKRFWNGRDHGLHATAVEEVFREFYLADAFKTLEWDNMKKAAHNMWLPNDGLSGNAQHAGTYLLEQLMALKRRRLGLTVDIVAHSAGAIVTCELFATIRERYSGKLSIRNVIFLAPACTSESSYTKMLVGEPLYGDFHMFTMPDDLERRDAVLRPVHNALGVVYPSSLLYVVSGMLEDELDSPLLGMVRYGIGKAPFDSQKLKKIREYLAIPGKARLTLSAAGDPPAAGQIASRATSHGAFSSDETTMRSIQLIIERSNA